MGADILEYEAKTILNKGIEHGIERGIQQANIVSDMNNLSFPRMTFQY